jgi:7,8-dihydropterin-6-yl-methyl-4-(beta-D-ribofuranosyl)aminobenzene 5'-phosphate synthase
MSANAVELLVVADNHAGDGLLSEHGFSAWIEVGERRVLFDTGQGVALEHNARALDVALWSTDSLVLSHGHYDHTGGVPHVLDDAPAVHVYAHPDATRARWSIHGDAPRAIGMPPGPRAAIDVLPASRRHWITEPMELEPGLGLTTSIPRRAGFEDPGGPFFLDPHGHAPDTIPDDLALWIRTERGLVVVVGCCHAGLVNTVQAVQESSGERRVDAIVGGLHLRDASPGRLDRTVEALWTLDPALIVACHCTGDAAVARLRESLGPRVQVGAAGASFSFGGWVPRAAPPR